MIRTPAQKSLGLLLFLLMFPTAARSENLSTVYATTPVSTPIVNPAEAPTSSKCLAITEEMRGWILALSDIRFSTRELASRELEKALLELEAAGCFLLSGPVNAMDLEAELVKIRRSLTDMEAWDRLGDIVGDIRLLDGYTLAEIEACRKGPVAACSDCVINAIFSGPCCNSPHPVDYFEGMGCEIHEKYLACAKAAYPTHDWDKQGTIKLCEAKISATAVSAPGPSPTPPPSLSALTYPKTK